jgi:D-tyrosyl-tRNA(Tyr) deacylase
LLASTKKGNKPDFHGALNGDEARRLYECFYRKVQEGYAPEKVQNGVFQAMMQVALVNDGPVRALTLLFFDKVIKLTAQRLRWR